MRLCGVVILLSRGEFGHERNKISYERVCVWTFCYMSNLWYDIIILQHIFILRKTWRERSYFVFNLGSFERTRECDSQVFVFTTPGGGGGGGRDSHQLPYGGVPLYRVNFERPVSLKWGVTFQVVQISFCHTPSQTFQQQSSRDYWNSCDLIM